MKIYSGFEKDIHNTLAGNFKKVADRYDISRRYVSMISNSKREIKSQTSLIVFVDLLEILKVLDPDKYELYLLSINEGVIVLFKERVISIYGEYLKLIDND